MKVKLHRAIPQDADRKTVAIKRQGCHWYACIEVMLPKPPALPKTGKAVGIDLGITTFAALSTGDKISGPRAQRRAQERIASLHRAVARKQKGSNRRRKALARLARARLHEARVRRDHHFKVARSLVNRFDLIAIENLDVGALGRSMLAKDVFDQGWAQFRSILSDKAEEAGRQMVLVNPRRTSQACSGCNRLVSKTLTVRIHSCSHCGLTLDRDVNAARNILRLGASQQDAAPAESPMRPFGAARLRVESSG
jgi:putative transposase